MPEPETNRRDGRLQGNPSPGQRRGEKQTGKEQDPDLAGAKAERARRRRTRVDRDPGRKHQGETT